MKHLGLLLWAGVWTLCIPLPALAADTVETWAIGFTDVDIYVGLDGIGRSQHDHQLHAEIMIGAGLTESLSAYLGTASSSNGALANSEPGVFFGVFATPLDSDHVDLDLFLGAEQAGPGLIETIITPAVELNLDVDPDLASWGIYARVGFPLTSNEAGEQISGEVTVNPGVYWTIADGHQLLGELDSTFTFDGDQGTHAAALGYNVVLSERLELINEARVIHEVGGEERLQATTGLVATLP